VSTVFVLNRPSTKWDAWGDYASLLLHGMTGHRGRKGARLQLERTGPFVPKVTFPGIGDVILTDAMKSALDRAMPGLEYRPVVSARIVRLDWTSWPVAEEPLRYPKSGEPEDYILAAQHDEALAKEMGQFWELVADVDRSIQLDGGWFVPSAYGGQHFVRASDNGGIKFVSAELRRVLEQLAPECVAFSTPRSLAQQDE
jgi:hypothetical protein